MEDEKTVELLESIDANTAGMESRLEDIKDLLSQILEILQKEAAFLPN